MKFAVNQGQSLRRVEAGGAQYRRDLRTAAIIATDRASKEAQRAVQERIRSVGLGRLANAVGQMSAKRDRGFGPTDKPYGSIFARGGDDSQGGGALEAYSRGATITAGAGKQWLAIATNAVPKFITLGGRRFRTTPQLYKNSSLASSIGPLKFKPIGNGRALLVIERANVSPKTGRAKAPGARKSRSLISKKDVVAFVLIRVTIRAKRFDKDQVVILFAQRVPNYIQEALDAIGVARA